MTRASTVGDIFYLNKKRYYLDTNTFRDYGPTVFENVFFTKTYYKF